MTLTSHFGFYKPDNEDDVSVTRDVGGNMQMIDDAIFYVMTLLANTEDGATTSMAYSSKDLIIRNGEFWAFKAATPSGTTITEYNGNFNNAPSQAGVIVRVANDLGNVGILNLFAKKIY